MKKLKRMLAVIMMMVMMVPVTAFAAEGETASPDITSVDGAVAASVDFNGKTQEAVLTVTVNGKTITLTAEDYNVVEGSLTGKNAGTYEATIQGIGKFTGEAKVTFEIKAADIKNAKVTVKNPVYNGKMQKTSVVVVANGRKLTEGKDFEVVSGASRKSVGSYKIVIAGKGNYAGKISKDFSIRKADQTMTVKATKTTFYASTLKKKSASMTIKKSGVLDKAKVTYSCGSKKITISSTGKVTIAKGTKKGTYRVKVVAAATKNCKSATKYITITVK